MHKVYSDKHNSEVSPGHDMSDMELLPGNKPGYLSVLWQEGVFLRLNQLGYR